MKLEKGDYIYLLLNLPRGGEELEEISNVLEGIYVGKEKLGVFSKILRLGNVKFRGVKSQLALIPSSFIRKMEKAGKKDVPNVGKTSAFETMLIKIFFKISTTAFGFYIARYNTSFGGYKWNLLINGNTMASPSMLLSQFIPRSPIETYADYIISVEYGRTVDEIVEKMKKLRELIDYSIAKAGCLIIMDKECKDDVIIFAKNKFFDIWVCEDLGTTKSSLNALQGTKYICGALVDLKNREIYMPEKAPLPKILFNILKNSIPRALKRVKSCHLL